MNVAIVGSRNYADSRAVIDYVNALPADTVIVSGGARGVDTVAVKAAQYRGLKTLVYLAEWDKYGRSAGYRRNHDIIKAADRVVAFWDGRSAGTAHSIGLCKQYGKPLEVIP